MRILYTITMVKSDNVTGDFIVNHASGFYAMRGALDNRGTLGDMEW